MLENIKTMKLFVQEGSEGRGRQGV
jgi:hypothetical protein